MRIQFELPSDRFEELRLVPAFGEIPLTSEDAAACFEFTGWLPNGRCEELQRSWAFAAGEGRIGRTHYTILIDKTQSDKFVIYVDRAS